MRRPRKGLAWLLLISALAAAVALVITPAWLIQPFKHQTPTILKATYLMRGWSTAVTAICAAASIVLGVYIWRHSRRWYLKGLLVPVLAMTILMVWLSRQNHFEWFFKPLPNPGFTIVEDADFGAPDDMVIAVELNDEAVAFPIRQAAYHHIIEDEVGGVPIAATY